MTTLDQICSHLEFLGFALTKAEDSKRASHAQRWNLVIRKYKGGVLFSSFLTGNEYAKDTGNRQAYLELVNRMNQAASVARFYLDDDLDFVMEAWWVGEYERVSFGKFIDLWDADTRAQLHKLDPERFFN